MVTYARSKDRVVWNHYVMEPVGVDIRKSDQSCAFPRPHLIKKTIAASYIGAKVTQLRPLAYLCRVNPRRWCWMHLAAL